jgi:glycosyltransferase involved in cell wall biosynthesis
MQSISICLATYNGEKWIKRQIDSILEQVRFCDELLIADDGSNDHTLEILKTYGNSIRIVGTNRVGGVVKNFERLLISAKCDLIVLSDQDDVWLQGKLETARTSLLKSHLIMMDGYVVSENLSIINNSIFKFVSFKPGFFNTFSRSGYVGCCMAFRRSLLDVALPFPSNIRWHDWYLGLVAELLFRCDYINRKTLLFRRHLSNNSETGKVSRTPLLKKIFYRFWMFIAILIVIKRYMCMRLKYFFKNLIFVSNE